MTPRRRFDPWAALESQQRGANPANPANPTPETPLGLAALAGLAGGHPAKLKMPPAPTLAENVIRLADLRAAMAARAEALVGIIEAARAEALVGIIEAARAEEGGPLEPPDAG